VTGVDPSTQAGLWGPAPDGGPRARVSKWVTRHLLRPDYSRRERRVVSAADGTRIHAAVLPGPPGARGAVVLVHGFASSSRDPIVFRFAHLLAERFEVVVPDLRGHGRSAGRCTFGELEPLDVQAALALVTPGRPTVTVGVSLGAASVLLHAADHQAGRFGDGGPGGKLVGVVAVSAPAWFGEIDRPGAANVAQNATRRWRRAALAALLGTRVSDPRRVELPVAAGRAEHLARLSVLLVHDPYDRYFGPEHVVDIVARVGPSAKVWWVRGGGHGTELLTTALARRIAVTLAAMMAGDEVLEPGSPAGPEVSHQGG
jgi:pimeloyl-ACP methyl ester carboxylesterase